MVFILINNVNLILTQQLPLHGVKIFIFFRFQKAINKLLLSIKLLIIFLDIQQ